MNVAVWSHAWATETSGVGHVVKNLCDYLRDRGHTVIILRPGSTELMQQTHQWGHVTYELNLRPPVVEGHAVKSRVSFALLMPAVLYQLSRLLKTRSIQIINAHYPDDSFVYAAICRRLLAGQLRLLTSIHGADLFPGGRPRAPYSPAIRSLLASSDAIVAPSVSFLNDTLETFSDLEGKLVCIHHGIRNTEFDTGEPPHAPADPYILCVAMHNEKKGLDTLIRAFRTVAAVYDRLTLRLVGDGPLRPMLEALARAHGLSGRIEFLGALSRPEIVRLMKETDLFVLPSRSEPFGLALLEAAVCRRAIVATDVGGIPEIIRHEVSGLLVPPDNVEALSASLLRLLDRPSLRRALGESAYQTVSSRFSWEMMGGQYESLMSRLVPVERRGAARPEHDLEPAGASTRRPRR